MSEDTEPTVEDYIRELAGEEPKPKPEPKAEEQEATATSTDGEDADAEESEETSSEEGESTEEQEASTDDEESDDSDEEEEDKPKRRRSRPDPKKRIRKLVAERNTERDENARLRAERDILLRQVQQAQPGSKPAEQPLAQEQDVDPQPQQDQYTDYAQYLEDRAKWASRQEVKKTWSDLRKQAQADHQKQTAQARETEVVTQAKALFAKGVEEFEDFEEVAADPSLPVTEAMTSAMLASEIGHQVQYHLGNHPEEATRISKLNPVQQVREMALLEASLTAPKAKPKKKTTSAPEPIKPVGGKSAPKSVDEDNMPIDEYMKRYNAGELPSQR